MKKNHVLFPQKLKKGAKIAVVSPAGAVEPAQLVSGIELIRAKGYNPVLGQHLYDKFSNGYNYAGTEKERAADLNWALNEPEISAVWASRGGYGCHHIIKDISLKNFRKNPKWYIGYSDNTVIQSYLLKNNFASIHGQTIKTSSFGVTPEAYESIFSVLEGKKPTYSLEGNSYNRKGRAEGLLVGGNLALIYALLGTKYAYDFKDNILFMEDIGEQYYSLDRMLMSLEMAGVFGKISGLVVGGMTNMGDENTNKNYENSFDELAYEIISQRIKNYSFPVAFAFPNGHIFDNRPLIVGAHAELKVGKGASLKFT